MHDLLEDHVQCLEGNGQAATETEKKSIDNYRYWIREIKIGYRGNVSMTSDHITQIIRQQIKLIKTLKDRRGWNGKALNFGKYDLKHNCDGTTQDFWIPMMDQPNQQPLFTTSFRASTTHNNPYPPSIKTPIFNANNDELTTFFLHNQFDNNNNGANNSTTPSLINTDSSLATSSMNTGPLTTTPSPMNTESASMSPAPGYIQGMDKLQPATFVNAHPYKDYNDNHNNKKMQSFSSSLIKIMNNNNNEFKDNNKMKIFLIKTILKTLITIHNNRDHHIITSSLLIKQFQNTQNLKLIRKCLKDIGYEHDHNQQQTSNNFWKDEEEEQDLIFYNTQINNASQQS